MSTFAILGHHQTLEEIDKLVEELGIEVMTPRSFIRKRRELEVRFKETYRIAPALIAPSIKSGEIQDSGLVREWIALMEFEPALFPVAHRPPPDGLAAVKVR